MPPGTERKSCPSCGHRLSPLAVECPVCGLSLGSRALQRPLLFQASAFKSTPGKAPSSSPAPHPSQGIVSPALGRVSPIPIQDPLPPPAGGPPSLRVPPSEEPGAAMEVLDSNFWSLVKLEASEAALLLSFNAFLILLASWQVGTSALRCYEELWPYLLPVHLGLSWAVVLIPMVLTGQSVRMVPMGLMLASEQPERRLAFSLFHLFSVLAFPLSFLCMILTPNHRTLAELLTGQEILLKPLSTFGQSNMGSRW